ncbi:MAG: winged helix-turn-helix domain-containing protein [Candidatus Accumulibacter sp.]|jgi:transposase|nr:winged helix-turn-helix domain-containing protein [Accumulibacter sp.]
MSRPFKGEEAVVEALTVLATTKSLEQFRQAQAVVLPLRHGLSLEQTAEALGLTPGWVSHLRNRFIAGERVNGEPARGGRRHAHFTPEEEADLLRPFFEETARGSPLLVSRIKTQLEARLQHTLALSSVYALLHRHGWRKPIPGKRHSQNESR